MAEEVFVLMSFKWKVILYIRKMTSNIVKYLFNTVIMLTVGSDNRGIESARSKKHAPYLMVLLCKYDTLTSKEMSGVLLLNERKTSRKHTCL